MDRSLCPWNSLSKNTRMVCHSLLQGIFLTQGLNPDLPPCKQILYHLGHQGSTYPWVELKSHLPWIIFRNWDKRPNIIPLLYCSGNSKGLGRCEPGTVNKDPCLGPCLISPTHLSKAEESEWRWPRAHHTACKEGLEHMGQGKGQFQLRPASLTGLIPKPIASFLSNNRVLVAIKHSELQF